MADTEFRALPAFEPTFVKPLDAASRRRSRASHDSAAASTRSWVLMTQQSPPPPVQPIPIPEPVPALTPAPAPRPLPEPPRRTSAVDEPGAEHMTVEVPNPSDMGYQWTTGRGTKAREAHRETHREEKGLVGGFVSGLRRLPRALVRTRRPRRGTTNTEGTEGTEGTGMSGNTLPRYVSVPPTPVVPTTGSGLGLVRGVLATPGGQVTATGNADAERRRHPSFRVVPPEEDVQQVVVTPVVYDPDPEPGELEFPQVPMENPYDREATSAPPPTASPHLSRVDDRLAAAAEGDGDEPISVHVHPLPTVDYRRMSAHDTTRPHSRTTITSTPFSSDSPSFSSELHGFRRFFNALHLLPWVATDRLTIDYFPPRAKGRASVSWYHPEAQSACRGLEPPLAPAPPSPPAASDRANNDSARTPPRHRTLRRAATSVYTPAPSLPAAYGYPFAYYPAFSPSPPPTQPTHGSRRSVSPRPRSPRAHSSHAHRHHRRSATYPTSPTQWIPPPLLPAPPAPVYIIRATPSPPASPPPHPHTPSQQSQMHPDTSSLGATQGDSPAAKHAVAAQLLAPVYIQMQVLPGAGGSPQFTLVQPQGGEVAYTGYAYSPIAMPAPVQTV
ncbi:hypothetical protein C8F04DRAFT_1322720 [Mycena alexandri]|uniref:Uncharacterized protein n=1 Tax=Mycena alexandri TaxID=1745969 RepID=A0AAD6XBB7_9AGAR|nr:hypothetical protein C8F04DRAFT_1322720 [Mycena alexandri]